MQTDCTWEALLEASARRSSLRSIEIAFVGHQMRPHMDDHLIRRSLRYVLSRIRAPFSGICCLAAGSDQIFGECVLESGRKLITIVPKLYYVVDFKFPQSRLNYIRLLARSEQKIYLNYAGSSEDAFLAAGIFLIKRASGLIAVWDENKNGGRGGTADIVARSQRKNLPILVINPVTGGIKGGERWPFMSS